MYDRYRVPARFKNGGFPSEKVYWLRTAQGEDFKHLGFTSYLFSEDAKRLPDKDIEGERSGFCEVIFLRMANAHTAVVLPPQVHGCDNSGPIEVAKNDLLPIPRSEWNDHDHYGM